MAKRNLWPGAAQVCRAGCASRENQTSSWKPKAQPGRPRARRISRSPRRFFLSWQSWLAEELFEPAEVGWGIAGEPRPQHAGVPTALEAGAHLTPARPLGAGQIAGVPAAQPGGQTGEEPHRAAQHRRRAVGLAAGRPPLVAAVRPEQL